jgi:polyisoprenyl-phosphate glycosyltransferase
LQPGQADFTLWDGAALRSVREYLPHVGSLRVFAAWMPGPHERVEYDQNLRQNRQSRFSFRKNYELAAISIIRFSHVPLTAITAIGILGLMFAVAYGSFVIVETAHGNTVPGWSSIVLTVMTMGCLQLISVGILASYLRRLVFARDLPLYVIREAHVADVTSEAAPHVGEGRQQIVPLS